MSQPLRTIGAAPDAIPGAVPEARDFPSWPVGWHTVARSRDVGRRPRTVELAGAEIVLFRATSGGVRAIAAHCPHMGTHLRHGEVEGEGLRCPMHHWVVEGDGRARGPAGACATSRGWPVAEAHGLVFLHLGGAPRVPPPAPAEADAYSWRSAGPLPVATSWQNLVVSGFDMQHLSAVHHRRLVRDPEVTWLDDGRLRLAYVSRVAGGRLADRVMGWLGREGIEVSMTCSGPVFVVESRLGRLRTCAILGLLGRDGGVDAYGSFAVRGHGFASRFATLLARWLYTSFLRKDFAIIEGMRLRTHGHDVGVAAMSRFLASLPEAKDA